eukprot:3114249-Amphidinium_carterae.1
MGDLALIFEWVSVCATLVRAPLILGCPRQHIIERRACQHCIHQPPRGMFVMQNIIALASRQINSSVELAMQCLGLNGITSVATIAKFDF